MLAGYSVSLLPHVDRVVGVSESITDRSSIQQCLMPTEGVIFRFWAKGQARVYGLIYTYKYKPKNRIKSRPFYIQLQV